MESADYEKESMLMNCFFVIILSYDQLHEAQWHIIKMCQVEKSRHIFKVCWKIIALSEGCRVRIHGTKHVDSTP